MGLISQFSQSKGQPRIPKISSYDVIKQVQSNLPLLKALETGLTRFTDRYYGELEEEPSHRPNGTAIQVGDIYTDSTDDAVYIYSANQWVNLTYIGITLTEASAAQASAAQASQDATAAAQAKDQVAALLATATAERQAMNTLIEESNGLAEQVQAASEEAHGFREQASLSREASLLAAAAAAVNNTSTSADRLAVLNMMEATEQYRTGVENVLAQAIAENATAAEVRDAIQVYADTLVSTQAAIEATRTETLAARDTALQYLNAALTARTGAQAFADEAMDHSNTAGNQRVLAQSAANQASALLAQVQTQSNAWLSSANSQYNQWEGNLETKVTTVTTRADAVFADAASVALNLIAAQEARTLAEQAQEAAQASADSFATQLAQMAADVIRTHQLIINMQE
jgi:uncharacterized coiled-coil DUF342 family protein